jgi:hypothetical protein
VTYGGSDGNLQISDSYLIDFKAGKATLKYNELSDDVPEGDSLGFLFYRHENKSLYCYGGFKLFDEGMKADTSNDKVWHWKKDLLKEGESTAH